MRKLPALLLCILLGAQLTACDSLSPEKQAYVIAMAIDTKEGGLELTLQFPQSGSSQQSGGYAFLSVLSDSLDGGLTLLKTCEPYPLNFSQLRLIVLGSAYASTADLRKPLETLMRLPNLRPSATVAVAVGNGGEVIRKQQPDMGMRMSKHIDNTLRTLQAQGVLPASAIGPTVAALQDGDPLLALCAVKPGAQEESGGSESSQSQPAWSEGSAQWTAEAVRLFNGEDIAGALPRIGLNPVEFLGAAVTRNGCVVGMLSGDEMQAALMLAGSATLRCAARDRLQLQALLPEEQLSLADDALLLIGKLQALQSDALGFGRAAMRAFLTESEWQAYGFQARYATADVYVGP